MIEHKHDDITICCYGEYGSHHQFSSEVVWDPGTPHYIKRYFERAHRAPNVIMHTVLSLGLFTILINIGIDTPAPKWIWVFSLLPMLWVIAKELYVENHVHYGLKDDSFRERHDTYFMLDEDSRAKLKPLYLRMLNRALSFPEPDEYDAAVFDKAVAAARDYQTKRLASSGEDARQSAIDLINSIEEAKRLEEKERKAILS